LRIEVFASLNAWERLKRNTAIRAIISQVAIGSNGDGGHERICNENKYVMITPKDIPIPKLEKSGITLLITEKKMILGLAPTARNIPNSCRCPSTDKIMQPTRHRAAEANEKSGISMIVCQLDPKNAWFCAITPLRSKTFKSESIS